MQSRWQPWDSYFKDRLVCICTTHGLCTHALSVHEEHYSSLLILVLTLGVNPSTASATSAAVAAQINHNKPGKCINGGIYQHSRSWQIKARHHENSSCSCYTAFSSNGPLGIHQKKKCNRAIQVLLLPALSRSSKSFNTYNNVVLQKEKVQLVLPSFPHPSEAIFPHIFPVHNNKLEKVNLEWCQKLCVVCSVCTGLLGDRHRDLLHSPPRCPEVQHLDSTYSSPLGLHIYTHT